MRHIAVVISIYLLSSAFSFSTNQASLNNVLKSDKSTGSKETNAAKRISRDSLDKKRIPSNTITDPHRTKTLILAAEAKAHGNIIREVADFDHHKEGTYHPILSSHMDKDCCGELNSLPHNVLQDSHEPLHQPSLENEPTIGASNEPSPATKESQETTESLAVPALSNISETPESGAQINHSNIDNESIVIRESLVTNITSPVNTGDNAIETSPPDMGLSIDETEGSIHLPLPMINEAHRHTESSDRPRDDNHESNSNRSIDNKRETLTDPITEPGLVIIENSNDMHHLTEDEALGHSKSSDRPRDDNHESNSNMSIDNKRETLTDPITETGLDETKCSVDLLHSTTDKMLTHSDSPRSLEDNQESKITESTEDATTIPTLKSSAREFSDSAYPSHSTKLKTQETSESPNGNGVEDLSSSPLDSIYSETVAPESESIYYQIPDLRPSLTMIMYTLFCIICVSSMKFMRWMKQSKVLDQPTTEPDLDIGPLRDQLSQFKRRYKIKTSLHDEVDRITRQNDSHQKRIQLQNRLAPILKALEPRENVQQVLQKRKSLLQNLQRMKVLLQRRQELAHKVQMLRYEYFMMITNFIAPQNLLDLMKHVDFKKHQQSLQSSTLEMMVENEFLHEEVDLFRKLAVKFQDDYKTLTDEISRETIQFSLYEEELSKISNVDLDTAIDSLKKKIAIKEKETDKYYKDYIKIYYWLIYKNTQ